MASTYVIRLSGLTLASDTFLPDLVEEVRRRRSDLRWVAEYAPSAFEGDLFDAPKQAFLDVIEELQNLHDKTIKRLEMGSEGLDRIVRHHERNEAWVQDTIKTYIEEELADVMDDYAAVTDY